MYEFDENNYDGITQYRKREAARAIIYKQGKLAMVYSKEKGYYKFPGGGIEENETKLDALLRETKEETGLLIKESTVKEFGMTHEIRKSVFCENEIFEQISYYYFAEVEEVKEEQNLDNYEAELGYCLKFVTPKEAYEENIKRWKQYSLKFILREAKVLKFLAENNGRY